MLKISHDGIATKPSLQVNESMNDQFQLWQDRQFEVAASMGIELIYQHENVDICKDNVVSPFCKESEEYYSLMVEGVISTDKDNLLIIPHHRYYTDMKWETPLPVSYCWATAWWPFPLKILFRHNNVAKFRKGEPFAQAVIVTDCNILTMTEKDKKDKDNIAKEINEKCVVRKWTTSSGIEKDNLYNVAYRTNERGEVGISRRKFKFVKVV